MKFEKREHIALTRKEADAIKTVREMALNLWMKSEDIDHKNIGEYIFAGLARLAFSVEEDKKEEENWF